MQWLSWTVMTPVVPGYVYDCIVMNQYFEIFLAINSFFVQGFRICHLAEHGSRRGSDEIIRWTGFDGI
jgi:hypothetical protein